MELTGKENSPELNKPLIVNKEQAGGQQNNQINTQPSNIIGFDTTLIDRSCFPNSPDMISAEQPNIPLLSLNCESRPESFSINSPAIGSLDFATTPTLLRSFMNAIGGTSQNNAEEL